jgi:hypothetical protein
MCDCVCMRMGERETEGKRDTQRAGERERERDSVYLCASVCLCWRRCVYVCLGVRECMRVSVTV